MDTIAIPVSATSVIQSLGSAAAPMLIDARRTEAFHGDACMAASATWRDPFAIYDWHDWVQSMPRHRPIVVYCVHGHEIS